MLGQMHPYILISSLLYKKCYILDGIRNTDILKEDNIFKRSSGEAAEWVGDPQNCDTHLLKSQPTEQSFGSERKP